MRGRLSPAARKLLEAYDGERLDVVDDPPADPPAAGAAPAGGGGGAAVRGLTHTEVSNLPEASALLAASCALRETAATAAHAGSSRSHLVTTFSVVQAPIGADSGPVLVSKLNLVDLAGSESAKRVGADDRRLQEAKAINGSLAALGNVVAALSEGGRAAHVPFRDAKLTRILKVPSHESVSS